VPDDELSPPPALRRRLRQELSSPKNVARTRAGITVHDARSAGRSSTAVELRQPFREAPAAWAAKKS
jgi:hypothetical protein